MPYPLNSCGCSLWNTLDPAVNFKLRLSLVRHGLSVLVPWWWEYLRWTCQISFRTVLGRGRGDKETFCRRISSVFIFTTFNTVGWHCVITENGIGSGLPDFQSFILSLSRSDPIYGISGTPSTWYCTVPFVDFENRSWDPRRWRILLVFLLLYLSPCKQSWMEDGMHTESDKRYTLHMYGIHTFSHNNGTNLLPPEWPWLARM